jgi:hypothetical protein
MFDCRKGGLNAVEEKEREYRNHSALLPTILSEVISSDT